MTNPNEKTRAQTGDAVSVEVPDAADGFTLGDAPAPKLDLTFGDAEHLEDLDSAAGFASAAANQP